jgi:membrane protease YdiL (CAAX protease family)
MCQKTHSSIQVKSAYQLNHYEKKFMDNEIISIKEYSSLRWGFVGTLVWGTFIAVAFIFIQIVAMGIYIEFNFGEVGPSEFEHLMIDLQDNGAVISLCTFATTFICSVMVLLAIKLKKGSNIKDYIGLKNVTLKTAGCWLLGIVIFIICSDTLTILLGRSVVPEFMISVYTSIENVWILWLAIIVAAPLFEELFFRGFIFAGLSSSFIGPIGSIFFTSLLWSFIHIQYEFYEISIIFFMGLILGTARWKTGSVLLPIGLHSFINFVATIETMIYVS